MVMNLGSRFFGNIIRSFPMRSFCSTVSVSGRWAGRDSPSKREKLEATKSLKKRADSPPSVARWVSQHGFCASDFLNRVCKTNPFFDYLFLSNSSRNALYNLAHDLPRKAVVYTQQDFERFLQWRYSILHTRLIQTQSVDKNSSVRF